MALGTTPNFEDVAEVTALAVILVGVFLVLSNPNKEL